MPRWRLPLTDRGDQDPKEVIMTPGDMLQEEERMRRRLSGATAPEDPFVTEIEEMLYRITINYRFEGKTLERVQAEQVIREVRRHDAQKGTTA